MKGTVVPSTAYFSEPRMVGAWHKRGNEDHPGVSMLKASRQWRLIHVTNVERAIYIVFCVVSQ